MSSAWSHGTLIRRRVTLPCTVSLATILRLDSSAISCSTVRTGTSWKLKVTGRPLNGRAAVAAFCAVPATAVALPTARDGAAVRGTSSTM